MEYLVKRELKNLNRMGMKVVGPVDQYGTPLAGSNEVGLNFSRTEATIGNANLTPGAHYRAEILIYGDPDGKLTISAAVDQALLQFTELFQISVPTAPTNTKVR